MKPTDAFCNPATGRTIDVVHPATGRGVYSGLTLQQLQEREGAQLVQLSLEQAELLREIADRGRLCLPPVEESAEAANQALNVLPPFRWTRGIDFEAFAVGEPLTDRLRTWHVRIGRRWFTFNEDRALSFRELGQIVRDSAAFRGRGGRMSRPHRYRMEGIPGLADAREWSPSPPPQARPEQGWLPFSDGGQLGPLFDHAQPTTPEEQ